MRDGLVFDGKAWPGGKEM